MVVKNAVGRLKERWRSLLKRNDCDILLVKSMVLICFALHNLCEDHGQTYETSWDIPEATALEPVVAVAQHVEEEGRDVRDTGCAGHAEPGSAHLQLQLCKHTQKFCFGVDPFPLA